MASSSNLARDFLKEYLALNRGSLTASQIHTLSIVIRSPQTEGMSVTHLTTLMDITLELTLADAKPIYQIGAASAAYVLSVISDRSQA